MAVCKLSQDILKSNFCGYSLKQIVELYLANFADVTATTIGAPTDGEGVEVQSITMAASAKWYKIEPNKDTATYTDSLQVGDGGSKYRQAEISWYIGGSYTPEMVNVLDALSLGKYIVVARLSDGQYIMFARLVGAEATVASLEAAAEATGAQGINVTFQANTTEAPLPLSAEAIKTVLGTE